ncbi:MAG: addiction module toxin, HicA family [SAR202 cluster bacterium Io17-Chloro-G6]|nr:MAG: addiction module toxin, HicA family [SAR202 cluster bacterium Io17-Chloro-G6]
MRPLPYREVIRRLNAAGFSTTGQRGSHVKFARSTAAGTYTAVVPRHREVAAGTLRSILRQAGRTAEEWESL